VSDWKIRFGTAGTSDSFAAQGYKSSLDVPEYTAKMGLNAFEYQCGRGVRLGLDKAAKMAAVAGPKDILFSVHAPYYISMSSLEEEKRLNSIQYLLQSAAVCKALGGKRIIFHSGSCGKQSREAALEKALDTMRRAVEALDEAGFADMTLCPETMGKIGQLGTLDEVLPQLNFYYDDGYGGQELFGYVWYEDGTWSDRGEYDGSEWWQHQTRPDRNAEIEI
jgi:deoxyribonuclease-4